MSKKESENETPIETNRRLTSEIESLKRQLALKEQDLQDIRRMRNREQDRNRLAMRMVHELVDMALYIKDKEQSHDTY